MVDATLSANKRAIYEILIAAGQTVTLAIEPASPGGIKFINNGSTPIYYQLGLTVTAKDGNADIIPVGLFAGAHIPPGPNTILAFTCATDNSLTVVRNINT